MQEWTEVINKIQGIIIDRDKLVDNLEWYSTDANKFLNLTSATQEMICEMCEITGWNDRLILEINSSVAKCYYYLVYKHSKKMSQIKMAM